MDDAAAVLGGVRILSGAARDTLEELAKRLREVRLPARRYLFRAGEEADRVYLVRSGRLQVVAGTDGEGQPPRVVRVLGPGAAIGELALLTGESRSASVRAIRDSDLYELDADAFQTALAADPALALSVARVLAEQLQRSGGLASVDASAGVFAIVGPRGELGDALVEAFATCGSAVALREQPESLDRLEAEHDHVLLLAEPDAPDDWRDYCLRQADHVVVCAGGDRVPLALDGRPCDVVFAGAPDVGTVAEWDAALHPRAHHVVASERLREGAERVTRRLTGRSLGLVLSGGGARGFAHIGVVDVLTRAGLVIDRVGGCSIGSLIGAMVATGMTPEEIAETCRREFVRRSPYNDYTLPRVSLLRARKASSMLRRVFGDARVEALERPLYTVSADLLSSRLVVHRRGLVADAVGASMAIPGLFPPVSRDGALLVDGGVLNNLPVDLMAAADEGPIVAVDVIRRLETGEGEAALPTIGETLSRATVLGSVERAEQNRTLARLVITPRVQDIPLRDFGSLERAIEGGREAAEQALAAGGQESLAAALQAQAARRARDSAAAVHR